MHQLLKWSQITVTHQAMTKAKPSKKKMQAFVHFFKSHSKIPTDLLVCVNMHSDSLTGNLVYITNNKGSFSTSVQQVCPLSDSFFCGLADHSQLMDRYCRFDYNSI